MADGQTLLADYIRNGSEAAFRELVERYIGLVYAAAVRLLDGDTHLAEDVAQTVFADLARMGSKLSSEVMLGGWLHRHTCFVAAKTLRGRRRRETRERLAVEMNSIEDHSASNLAQAAPLLDEAIDRLEADDRTAIVLRFFEQRNFRSVGEALGSSEEAARKRVDRALEKLQFLLKRRGVVISASVLAAALVGEAASAAPVGLAAGISGTALAGAAGGGGTTLTLLKFMSLTKLKIAAALVAAAMATTIVIQSQTNARLGKENQDLQEHLAALQQSGHGNGDTAGTKASEDKPVDEKQLNELLRLRGEVTSLKRQLAEAARNKEQDKRAIARQSDNAANKSPEPVDQLRELAVSKMNYQKKWLLASFMYAVDYQGQFPTNFDQLTPYFSKDASSPGNSEDTNRSPAELELVYQGLLSAITNPSSTIVIRGRQPWQTPSGWANDYGFGDGHGEVHAAADGNFDAWEKQHMQLPAPTQ